MTENKRASSRILAIQKSRVVRTGCSPRRYAEFQREMGNGCRAVLYNSCAKGNVLGGPLKDRTARERMALLRAEVSASARSRAEKGGAGGVLQILRRVESGVNT